MAQYNLGQNLRKLKQYEASAVVLQKATESDKENPIAFNNLGLTFFEKEDYREAMDAFTKAIELKPTAVHYNNRGLASYYINLKEDAIKDFDTALSIDNSDPTVYYNRGNVYLNKNRFDRAINDYE